MLNSILILLLIVLVIRMFFENKILSSTLYTIASEKFPGDFTGKRIILLSDLHNNSFGKNNEKLLEAIHNAKPDVIMIAGDMLVGHPKANNTVALNFVKELGKQYTVFYSKGNHEQKLSLNPITNDSSYKQYEDTLRNCNIRYLVNESEKFEDLLISGLDISMDFYRKRHRPKMSLEYLEETIEKPDKDHFSILLAHNPMYFKKYVKWGADLVLSGHVHGGIVHIPGLGGVISPQYIFFPKYDHGEYKEKSSTMILSRGLGAHTIKLRLFNLPELVIIDLIRKE